MRDGVLCFLRLCRRGAREVADLVCQLSTVADSLAKTMHRHMAREEAEVLPLLMRTLCAAEQRHMVWRILRAMPLRLLERVMPWVAGEAPSRIRAGIQRLRPLFGVG